MQDIFSMKQAVTRSISPENRTGEPGRGGATPLEMGSARNAARIAYRLELPAMIHCLFNRVYAFYKEKSLLMPLFAVAL